MKYFAYAAVTVATLLSVASVIHAIVSSDINKKFDAACEKAQGRALRTMGGARVCLKAPEIELMIVVQP